MPVVVRAGGKQRNVKKILAFVRLTFVASEVFLF